MTVVLRSDTAELSISPQDGARWTSLRVFGEELLGQAEIAGAYRPILSGSFVMAPYAGRIGNAHLDWCGNRLLLPATDPPHAIHGTVLDRPWMVLDKAGDRVALEVDLPGPSPFHGRVTQEVILRDARLGTRVTLTAAESMPVTLGLHPWFRRRLSNGTSARLSLATETMYQRGADGLPTGRRIPPPPGPYDDCFVLTGSPVLRWPGMLNLTITSDHAHWVVFDELDDLLCVEPQTGPPDAARLGEAQVVEAGGTTELNVTLEWRTDPPEETRPSRRENRS